MEIEERLLMEGKPQRRGIVSNEYLRGLVEGEGCFTFCFNKSSSKGGFRVPTFCIAMHVRDKELLLTLCHRLDLPHEIYEYGPYGNDGAKRGRCARLIVREFGNLKDKIIPFFYKKLYGNKGRQFLAWLERMGSDPLVSRKFQELYYLYKSGYYDNFPEELKVWDRREKYGLQKQLGQLQAGDVEIAIPEVIT